jgi:DNA-binding beta-propeller fold protein YncE
LSRSGGGSAFALFAVSREGLNLLRLAGADSATAGDYTLHLFVAGDADQNGDVDGLDAEIVTQLLGASAGDPAYLASADANRDGTIDTIDVQLLAADFGFRANRGPLIQGTDALTHIDLPVVINLTTLGSDPEGDELFFRVFDAQGGTATLAPGGSSVTFLPNPGYSGPATFQILADDGYATSIPAIVSVDVSDAPLLNLDFTVRRPRLKLIYDNPVRLDDEFDNPVPGSRQPGRPVDFAMHVIGDFADQVGVTLPASYLTFHSADPDVASVSSEGVLHATKQGVTILTVASHGVQAATAVSVDIPQDMLGQELYALGLDAYPDAVTLSSEGGSRQFVVFLAADYTLSTDLTSAAAGTRYFVNRPGVISVSADGLATALAEGAATVTIINGPAEAVIPVRVEEPRAAGAAVLGTDGGIVTAADGSMVALPPGGLAEDTTVSLTPRTSADLPQGVPGGFHYAAAFELDLGATPLAIPAQLAIRVDPSIAPGTTVYFLQDGDYLNDDGTTRPIWWQVESGVVGPDGMARTTSPPYNGIKQSGRTFYLVSYGDSDTARLKAQVEKAQALQITLALATDPFTLMGVVAYSAATGNLAALAVPPMPQPVNVSLQIIPPRDLPVTTRFDVHIEPGSVNTFTTKVPPLPTTPSAAPQITEVSVSFEETDFKGEPVLILQGKEFLGDGASSNDLTVTFKIGDENPRKVTVVPLPGGSDSKLRVEVPRNVTLGLADITVTRQVPFQVLVNGHVQITKQDIVSNVARINSEGTYVFVALPEAKYHSVGGVTTGADGQLAVLDGNRSDVTFGNLIARIDLGSGNPFDDEILAEDFPFPRDVAVTPDNSRAYVTLRGSGRVAVVDTVALRQVDVSGDQRPFESTGPITAPNGAGVDPALYGTELSQPTSIRGTIKLPDEYVLDEWRLSLISLIDPDEPIAVKHWVGTTAIDSNVLAVVDPSQHESGFYRLKVAATGTPVGGGAPLIFEDDSVVLRLEKNPHSREIGLPFGARPYGIAIDPAGKYAYVAVQSRYVVRGLASSYVFQIDIEPDSSTYNQVVRTIAVDAINPNNSKSAAPHGLRHLAVSRDGLHLYVTAPNLDSDPQRKNSWDTLPGNLIDIDLKMLDVDHDKAFKVVPGSAGTYGVAITPGRQDVAFTNAESDAGVWVTNSTAGTKRSIVLDLEKFASRRNPQLAVNNAHGIVFTPDGRYAIIAGRADLVTKTFGGGFNGEGIDAVGITGFLDNNNNPFYEAGNIGIIKDPLGPNPQLVAATRTVPGGYPTDLEISADGSLLYVSFQGFPVQAGEPSEENGEIDLPLQNGAVFVYDLKKMIQQVELQLQNDPQGMLMRKVGINDLPRSEESLRVPNALMDIRADYYPDYSDPDNAVYIVHDESRAPVATGGFPGGIAVQTRRVPLSVLDASGDSNPGTVFQHGAVYVTFGLPTSGLAGTFKQVTLEAVPSSGGAAIPLKRFIQSHVTDYLLNLDGLKFNGSPVLLPHDDYTMRLMIDFVEGTPPQPTTTVPLTVLTDTEHAEPYDPLRSPRRGTFESDDFQLATYGEQAVVIFGGGGTDTLDLGLSRGDVLSLNGLGLDAFTASTNSPPRQAIYHGTVFDFLELPGDREVYFQGIERLKFSDNTFKEIQYHPNDTNFADQWNLAVTDVPNAWRFTTGSSKVLLVSLDTGYSTPPSPLAGVPFPDDVDYGRFVANANAIQAGEHGHQSISIMSSVEDNGLGIAGINWNSPLTVQNVYNGVTVTESIINAVDAAAAGGWRIVFQGGIQREGWLTNGADAGPPGTPSVPFQPPLPELLAQFTPANINKTFFAVAAGNGPDVGIQDPTYTASVSGVAKLESMFGNVVSVGALAHTTTTGTPEQILDLNGDREIEIPGSSVDNALRVNLAGYSNRGFNLTLVAPTDSPATQTAGPGTVNPTFGGTSAANPNLAAIASLVWSIDTSMTGVQLRQLLIDTSMPIQRAAVSPGGGANPNVQPHPNPTHPSIVTPPGPLPYTITAGVAALDALPGSPATRNNDFGFGLINADAAVRRAYALANKFEVANLYLNNGLRNPSVLETGTIIADGAPGDELTLADFEVGPNADVALDVWSGVLEDLTSIELNVSVQDLAGGELAEARVDAVGADGLPTAGTIVLDDDAAGVGWYVDSTPFDHSEFAVALDEHAFRAGADSEALGKYDLFTVLMHEAGHLLGFDPVSPSFAVRVGTVAGSQLFVGPGITATLDADGEHLDSTRYGHDLMNDTLAPSERRLPSALDIGILNLVRSIEVGAPGAPSNVIKHATASQAGLPGQSFSGNATGQTTSLFLAAATNPELTNGDFAVADPADTGFGWTTSGSVAIDNGAAVLTENPTVMSGLAQSFIIPVGATSLTFTITGQGFATNAAGNPADAFEVALLDAVTDAPLTGTAVGLSQTDSFLNIQATGEIFFASGVAVSGRAVSGQGGSLDAPITVTLDLTGVQDGIAATLYFDLLGFSATASSLTIDGIRVLTADNEAPSALDDPATTAEDTAVTIDVVANDADDESDTLTPVIVTGPAHGTAVVNSDRTVTYTPNPNYFGPDTFTYLANDGLLDSNLAAVTIDIAPVNDAPVLAAIGNRSRLRRPMSICRLTRSPSVSMPAPPQVRRLRRAGSLHGRRARRRVRDSSRSRCE